MNIHIDIWPTIIKNSDADVLLTLRLVSWPINKEIRHEIILNKLVKQWIITRFNSPFTYTEIIPICIMNWLIQIDTNSNRKNMIKKYMRCDCCIRHHKKISLLDKNEASFIKNIMPKCKCYCRTNLRAYLRFILNEQIENKYWFSIYATHRFNIITDCNNVTNWADF